MSTQLLAEPAVRPMHPVPCRVRSVVRELDDTFTLELDPPAEGWGFAPGQFTMLYVFGVGEVPISISGDPSDQSRLVQTIRAVGPVTDALTSVAPGDAVGVRGPYGTQWPVDVAEGKDVVIVTGGIGLAPLRPALLHILEHRDRYQNVTLLYGARSANELLFADELQEWRGRFDLDVLITVDHGDRTWRGPVGVVTSLIRRASFDPESAIALICGPEIMMRFTIQELERKGMTSDRLYVSMERNMKCGIGLCGHCQLGKFFVCKDGPVLSCAEMTDVCWIREV
ncbi:MAG: FAD/NAD(P)-binding protein [Actinomycetota bacterium]